ncbi:M14 family metallopeptidase [Halobacillus naozhouensis]|uniref:M14 family metallopeptidase n=1 Tax=Halobacillus naozhouensis TaxID=554880 RepID=A0ABY8IZL3_9BACI|nr:M14 family metallopeptidase [Halobacillus naozhouensis]WFT75688.1 M14 family metallopeptidase [Halobacillus naozhouensis]
MEKTGTYFKSNYEESRKTFRNHLDTIKLKWPQAVLSSEVIGQEDDNTIDVIYSPAVTSNQQVLFFTTGEHGIEGHAGAGVLHLFVDEYLDQVDPETTGICLIHALNPWGMRHFRRVTENNIDLNRNYFYNQSSVAEEVNRNYAKERDLFLPNGKINDLKEEKRKLYIELGKALAREGYGGITKAKGMGQFEFRRGVYFGGNDEEESTAFLKEWQKKLLSTYPRVIHMDWHTALGPANEMTMVVSEHDSREEKELKSDYQIKNIKKFTPTDVKGDSTNHFHKVQQELYPETYLFSALFEFGTFGTSKKAELREFTTMILENHMYWGGAEQEEDAQWILDEFQAMFYPDDANWREAVVKETRAGIESVLGREGILAVNQFK